MKKQISFFAVILLMVASCTLSAQSNNDGIKKFTQSIRSHKNMEVSFTYRTTNDSNKPEETKQGKFYFQNGAYKMITDDQHTISDGTTTWHYIVEEEEVMVGNASDDDNPYKIIDNIERDGSSLSPVFDKKGNLKSLEITIDEGVKLLLNITEILFDQDYPKDFFTFDKKAHPNVEIIDMR